jgi:hypothetical protein
VADAFTVTGVTGTIQDIAFHPTNGNLYAITSLNELLEFTVSPTISMINKGTVTGDLPNTGNKGSAFFDVAGNMYISQNSSKKIYKVGGVSGTGPWASEEFSNAFDNLETPPYDGASCASAIPPSANPDTRTLINMATVNLPVITGPSETNSNIGVDIPGTYPIDPASIILTIPASGHNLTSPVLSNGGKTLTATEGTFQVNNNGTVSFTPSQNFNKTLTVNYTIKDAPGVGNGSPNTSNPTTIRIIANGTLPVDFGAVSAVFVNGQLVVNWSTLSESGNSHFDIEISKDGTNFTKIGSVDSKADKNGNSDAPIDYDFSINLQNGNTLLGIALFSIAFIALLFSRKNKWLYTVVLVGGLSIFGASSCSKDDAAGVEDTGKAFVRIKQVDKDGKFTYSKPVQVVKK